MEFAIAFKCDCGNETMVSGSFDELNMYIVKCLDCGKTIEWHWKEFKLELISAGSVKIPIRNVKIKVDE